MQQDNAGAGSNAAFVRAARAMMLDELRHSPIDATWAGLHDYDGDMPDLSADGFADTARRARANIRGLAAWNVSELSPADRIDHRLLVARFETEAREIEAVAPHRHEPSLYADAAVNGVYSLLARDFAPLADRLPALQSRLEQIPAAFDAGIANLKMSPAIWTEIAIEETQGAAQFFRDEIGPLAGGSPQMRSSLERALDACTRFASFLKDTHARRDGMSFAIGQELFDFKLRDEHLLPYDCGSLLAFGESTVRSTIAALEALARRIDPAGTWVDLVEKLRVDHPAEDRLLAEYRKGVLEARAFVAQRGLVTIPAGEELEVVDTPAFLSPTVPYAAYMAPGAFDVQQHGLYYVTPVSGQLSPAERAEALLGHNRFAMLLTNVHEAYPGHHVQLVCANKVPSEIRRLFDSNVFCEGWALYCEQLMLDEGMTDDPRVRLFQLKDQLWRACRVVIDVKLHTGRMSFDEAVAMLVDVAHLERPNAVGEVRRYTQSPTQPMSYLTGKQQIMELREAEKSRLGDAFALQAFHDRLLSFGTIPVSLISSGFPAHRHG
ncbi:MAG TPA: DUF885 domain-containing protein [Candidatus Eremiobacteraceae bacterium]